MLHDVVRSAQPGQQGPARSPTIQDVHIAYTLSRSEGVGVHEFVPIMHVHPNSTLQDDEDATAAVVSCLKQGLVRFHHHLPAASNRAQPMTCKLTHRQESTTPPNLPPSPFLYMKHYWLTEEKLCTSSRELHGSGCTHRGCTVSVKMTILCTKGECGDIAS